MVQDDHEGHYCVQKLLGKGGFSALEECILSWSMALGHWF